MSLARNLPALVSDVGDGDRRRSSLYVKLVKATARALGPRVVYDGQRIH